MALKPVSKNSYLFEGIRGRDRTAGEADMQFPSPGSLPTCPLWLYPARMEARRAGTAVQVVHVPTSHHSGSALKESWIEELGPIFELRYSAVGVLAAG